MTTPKQHFYIHPYRTPLLAAFMRPLHCTNSRAMWAGSVSEAPVELPRVTRKQRIRFAVLVALEVCMRTPRDKFPGKFQFTEWARNWLNGKDRSMRSARLVDLGISPDMLVFSGAVRAVFMRKHKRSKSAAAYVAHNAAQLPNISIDLDALASRALKRKGNLA